MFLEYLPKIQKFEEIFDWSTSPQLQQVIDEENEGNPPLNQILYEKEITMKWSNVVSGKCGKYKKGVDRNIKFKKKRKTVSVCSNT